jgi:hypothetical protein
VFGDKALSILFLVSAAIEVAAIFQDNEFHASENESGQSFDARGQVSGEVCQSSRL